MKSKIMGLLAVGLLAGPMAASASTIYSINVNGSTIDLSGFIEVSSLGSFTPASFDANVVSFSILASNNGGGSYLFTDANSTWGLGGFGSKVTINSLANSLQLVAPTGDDFDSANLFLRADLITNGARENLRFFDGNLGFRQSFPAIDVIFEQVGSPFTLGVARVPEPGTLALLGLGLAGLGLSRRRKAA